MHTIDGVEGNVERIAALFPDCVTEAQDEQGNLRHVVDFDKLKVELGDVVEGPEERYQFTWPGKRDAIRLANSPIAATLRPVREDSVDFDNTQNLYIEGDNLDVLKLLRETYLGKIKMIYIDPPYNTGNDFVYEDDFAENLSRFDWAMQVNDFDQMKASIEDFLSYSSRMESEGAYEDLKSMVVQVIRERFGKVFSTQYSE